MKFQKTFPIGVFDSGFGGISVWNEIIKLLPNESTIYYADSKNCPYGSKSQNEIIKLAENITEFLLSKSCKIIVVACNTATAAAIDYLRNKYDVIFIGMEPAVKPAAMQSKTGNIGILATKGTFEGRLFKETSQKYTDGINVHIQVGEGLVEKVEQGKENEDETVELLKKYIQPMLDKNIDQLVLGCTHYPFLSASIEKITNGQVKLVNPAYAVALQTQRQLAENNLLCDENLNSTHTFFLNGGDNKVLKKLVLNDKIQIKNLDLL